MSRNSAICSTSWKPPCPIVLLAACGVTSSIGVWFQYAVFTAVTKPVIAGPFCAIAIAILPVVPQPSPHFSDEREGLRQRFILSYEFSEAGDEWPQAGLGHVGYQLVEHAALPEQRMGSAFGGVDLEMTIHA